MKKVILLLTLIIGIIGFGKNLDSYASKRVFDGVMDVVLYGNGDKYANDVEVRKVIEDANFSQDEYEFFKQLSLGDDFQYKVTNVQEQRDKSVLTVSITYKTSEASLNQIMASMFLELDKMNIDINDDPSDEQIFAIMKNVKDKSNMKTNQKTMKINMKKSNGLWTLSDDAQMDELLTYILGPYMSIIEVL